MPLPPVSGYSARSRLNALNEFVHDNQLYDNFGGVLQLPLIQKYAFLSNEEGIMAKISDLGDLASQPWVGWSTPNAPVV